jgi:hypothetical protein
MAINTNQSIDHITSHFLFDGLPSSCLPFGNGHINNTFVVTTSTNKKYILQEINTNIFTNPSLLMSNMVMVTKQLKKMTKQGNALEVIPTKTGASYFMDANKKAWRVLNYFDNHSVYDKAPNHELAYEGAKMFGKFTNDLSVIAPEKIKAVIPNFHHMTTRLNQLESALKNAEPLRLKASKSLLEFIDNHKVKMCTLDNLFSKNKLKQRITHNDTKFNNVLFDSNHKGLCVIDLDTVMPGYLHYDFGDGVRTAVSTAEEDETDLSNITFDLFKLEAYTKGYIESTRTLLNETEKETLSLSVAIMPFIMGVRFLTDYLNNDKYYKIKYPNHNLDRSKAQLHLANEGLKFQEEINKFIYN